MPNDMKYRNNHEMYGTRNTYNAYHGERLYSRTSTAYDIPTVYPGTKTKTTPSHLRGDEQERKNNRTDKRSVTVNKAKVRKMVVAVGVVFVLCLTVLYRYAVLLQRNQEIEELTAELDALSASNQAMQTKIDKQLEISEIEKYAKSELGMMKPQAYQITYIDMNMGDGGSEGTVSERSASAVSGVPGALVNAFRVLK